MRLLSPVSLSIYPAGFLLLMLPLPAAAQSDVAPLRGPEPPAITSSRSATSGIDATNPVATPAQARQAHALTMAIFAKSGAAARATARVDAANQPDFGKGLPKIDWNADKGGVGVGGRGVEFKAPF